MALPQFLYSVKESSVVLLISQETELDDSVKQEMEQRFTSPNPTTKKADTVGKGCGVV